MKQKKHFYTLPAGRAVYKNVFFVSSLETPPSYIYYSTTLAYDLQMWHNQYAEKIMIWNWKK